MFGGLGAAFGRRRPGVGIEIEGDEVLVAAWGADGRLRLRAAGGGAERALADLAEREKLEGAAAVLVMPPERYQLFPLHLPPLPAEELREAARFKVRELIDFPLDEAVVDAFELPEAAQRGGERALWAVVARAGDVGRLVRAVRDAGLDLVAIDIAELALREVAAVFDAEAQGVAVLALHGEDGLLGVYRGEWFYLARRLELGWAALADGDEATWDRVVLEVQRSLDYYERHVLQPLPARLLVYPGDRLSGEALMYLNAQLSLAVEPLLPERLPEVRVDVEEAADGRGLYAVGAALRARREAGRR
ncbi:MAG: hypothetical protein KatS3mg121_1063 [Gammaproteobacteria bacterium]|nr:MAG: hypothetical protein KatS3mg121_1063 [Gammaproteobacteria bacterium]